MLQLNAMLSTTMASTRRILVGLTPALLTIPQSSSTQPMEVCALTVPVA